MLRGFADIDAMKNKALETDWNVTPVTGIVSTLAPIHHGVDLSRRRSCSRLEIHVAWWCGEEALRCTCSIGSEDMEENWDPDMSLMMSSVKSSTY